MNKINQQKNLNEIEINDNPFKNKIMGKFIFNIKVSNKISEISNQTNQFYQNPYLSLSNFPTLQMQNKIQTKTDDSFWNVPNEVN